MGLTVIVFFTLETQKKICWTERKKPYLSPLLKSGHLRMTLELKLSMGKISLLYANIAPKWNTMISRERQGLEILKALP